MIFGIGVDLDLGQAGIVGQGRRSKVKVKCQKSCFSITVTLLKAQGQRSGSRSKVETKVIGQGQRSRSNFWSTAIYIRVSALPSAEKSNKYHYQSKVFVRVSVIWTYVYYCTDEVDWLLSTSCVNRSGNVFSWQN